MSRNYISPADTAKYLRASLKAAFPSIRFGVRTSTYSGGASIRVTWTDGPMVKDVERTARHYAGASFDGMTDMKSHHSTVLAGPDGAAREVSWGADYVFCERSMSAEYRADLAIHAAHVVDKSAGHYVQGFDLEMVYYDLPTRWGVLPVGNGHQVVRYLSQYISPADARPRDGQPMPVVRGDGK